MTFVGEHLEEGGESPIVVDGPIEVLVLLVMLFHHHLPLGKIADHNSPFNQFVANEMRGLMQAIALFVTFLLRDTSIDLREMLIAS